jgi:hypothetical protein
MLCVLDNFSSFKITIQLKCTQQGLDHWISPFFRNLYLLISTLLTDIFSKGDSFELRFNRRYAHNRKSFDVKEGCNSFIILKKSLSVFSNASLKILQESFPVMFLLIVVITDLILLFSSLLVF